MTRGPAPSRTGRVSRVSWKHGARGVAILACLLLGLSGCTLGHGSRSGAGRTVTEPVVPSALVAVVPGGPAGPGLAGLAGLVASTARPGEDVDVLRAGQTARVVVAASAPAPAAVTLPGRPAAPGAEATSFQLAVYRRSVSRWQDAASRVRSAAAARTRAALAAWAGSLGIAGKVARLPATAGPAASLASGCAAAASALAGLDETAGASFGDRRVVLIYAPSLAGSPPPGQLTGDDVIVVTPFLPTAAAAATAQASLLAAGATRASILGPESTPAQLGQLVTLGLRQKVVTETLSGPALFANNSARLLPGAARVLASVIAPLRQAGAAAVINGYASTPGSSERNLRLSYARAAAVAAFLEAQGVPPSSLDIVGHGASDLVAPGPSGANRRVVVVIEEPGGTDAPS